MKRRAGKHPCRTFARIVRATRGTRPLPLDPLPSSLCSWAEIDVLRVGNLKPCRDMEERKSPWRENGSGNPCPTLEAELARRPYVDEGSPTMNQVMSVPNPRISG
jgi:hypothetical protein